MACAYPWVIFRSYYSFMFFYLLKATSTASYGYIPCGSPHPLHVVIFPINLRPRYWQFKDLIRDMTAIYVSFHDLSTPGEANSRLTSSGKGEKTKRRKVIECFAAGANGKEKHPARKWHWPNQYWCFHNPIYKIWVNELLRFIHSCHVSPQYLLYYLSIKSEARWVKVRVWNVCSLKCNFPLTMWQMYIIFHIFNSVNTRILSILPGT